MSVVFVCSVLTTCTFCFAFCIFYVFVVRLWTLHTYVLVISWLSSCLCLRFVRFNFVLVDQQADKLVPTIPWRLILYACHCYGWWSGTTDCFALLSSVEDWSCWHGHERELRFHRWIGRPKSRRVVSFTTLTANFAVETELLLHMFVHFIDPHMVMMMSNSCNGTWIHWILWDLCQCKPYCANCSRSWQGLRQCWVQWRSVLFE